MPSGQNSSLNRDSPIIIPDKPLYLPESPVDFGSSEHKNGKGLEVIANPDFTYVMNEDTDSVTILNKSGHIIKTVQVGESPNNIVIDRTHTKMYVTSNADILHPLVVVNYNETANAIEVGANPSAIAVDPKKNLVYVANFKSNDITVLNGTNTYDIDLNNQTFRIYKQIKNQFTLDSQINSLNKQFYNPTDTTDSLQNTQINISKASKAGKVYNPSRLGC